MKRAQTLVNNLAVKKTSPLFLLASGRSARKGCKSSRGLFYLGVSND